MKASKILCVPILLSQIGAIVIPAQAQSTTPQQTLQKYAADLQRDPSDNALREKIIALAHAMKPAPVVPEDAERHMTRGAAAVKGAKGTDDFKDAAAEFGKATLAAPWLADAYYNLGVAQDKAGLNHRTLQQQVVWKCGDNLHLRGGRRHNNET